MTIWALTRAAVLLAVLSITPAVHAVHRVDVSTLARGVAAAKQEVKAALENPVAAYEAYIERFAAVAEPRGHVMPGSPQDSKSKAQRLKIFIENLVKVDARNSNSSNALVAYGITPFTHLTQQEFSLNYLGQLIGPEHNATSADMQSLPEEQEGLSRKLAAGIKTQPSASPIISPSPDHSPQQSGKPHSSPTPAPSTAHGAPQPPEPSPALESSWETVLESGCTPVRDYPYEGVVPPAAVNWVASGGITPIKDQGVCGSCVAFATTALAEFMHMRKFNTTNTTTDLSEQDLLDCTAGDGCQGQYPTSYIDLIGCNGIAQESDNPYVFTDTDKCKTVPRHNAMSNVNGGGWAFVSASSEGLAQAVSQSPVMVSLDANDWYLYMGGVLDCNAPGSSNNHAVTVVGYFNRVRQPNGELWDLFLIKNSWGTWWGSGNGAYAGYIYLRKGCAAPGPSALFGSLGIVPLLG